MKFKHSLEDRNVFSYEAYRKHVDYLFDHNRTTGSNHSENMVAYTQLNIARMNRLDKRATIDAQLQNAIKSLEPQTWLVISEAWCGDAAQNLPYIQKMAEQNSNIDLKIILRDENLDIIDDFLTNGGRAIPKLSALDCHQNVLFTWGARPYDIQREFLELRDAGLPKSEISKTIQMLYTKDKGQGIQNDFLEIISKLEMVFC